MAEYKGTKNGGDDGRRKRPTQEDRRRTVGMIRDFFVHLLWELRLAVSVLTGGRRAVHPELQEQVDRFTGLHGGERLVWLPPKGGPSHVFALERCRCIEAVRHLEALDAELESGLRRFRPARAPRGGGYDIDLISSFLKRLGRMLRDRKPGPPLTGKRTAATGRRRGTGADDHPPASNGDAGQPPTPARHLSALDEVLEYAVQRVAAAPAPAAASDCDPTLRVEATETGRARTAIAFFIACLVGMHELAGESADAAISIAETILARIDNCAGMSLRDFPFLTRREEIEECSRIVLGKAGGEGESLTRDRVHHLLHCRLASIALKGPYPSATDRFRALTDLTFALAMLGGMPRQQADFLTAYVGNGIEGRALHRMAHDESDDEESMQAACEAVVARIRLLLGPQGYLAAGEDYLPGLLFGS
jgi:hypothetical protein